MQTNLDKAGVVVVGSTNPAKVRPVREVFGLVAPGLEVVGQNVASGVPEQPIGFGETLAGARNRANGALTVAGASWGVGLEGGVEFDSDGRGWLFGVVAVARAGRQSFARSASLELPPRIARRVRAGEELGQVMDGLSGAVGNNTRGGAFGHLTNGLLGRPDVWRQTLILALAPQLNAQLYAGDSA